MQLPEVALWRAVIQQAVTDSRITLEPIPVVPPLPPIEERKALWAMISPAERRELKNARLQLLHERLRILEEHRIKAEAVAWLRDAGLDFKLVCEMAHIEPGYMARKAKESNGVGVCLP